MEALRSNTDKVRSTTIHTRSLNLHVGVKSDPIEYRYSFAWLFRLMDEENVRRLQLGTFFEIYELPDDYFVELRELASRYGIRIQSVFTSHRELGGFFNPEHGFEKVARCNYERLIEVGRLVGAESVGSNPGAVFRDAMHRKDAGLACYLRHMKELMAYAREQELSCLTIEPMSCLAEPPTLPLEVLQIGAELAKYHQDHIDTTVPVGFCADIAHGYRDEAESLVFTNEQLFQATFPHLREVHLKNTDARFESTFGFGEVERRRGIVDIPRLRQDLLAAASNLPTNDLTGYLEIVGPKLGRDYSDHRLEQELRASLRFVRECFEHLPAHENNGRLHSASFLRVDKPAALCQHVAISPSLMCADQLNLRAEVRRLEALGVARLHIDVMDGSFVPNMPLGLGVLQGLTQSTPLPLDVHLMVSNNDMFVEWVLKAGARQISVHCESALHLDRVLDRIRSGGARAGVAINPGTSLSVLDYVIERIDYVLLMTVNPGFAGQELTPASLRKIADCRRLLAATGRDIAIQVDGNVSFENVPAMVAAGASDLVAGTSSLFNASASWEQNMARLHVSIAKGLELRSNLGEAIASD